MSKTVVKAAGISLSDTFAFTGTVSGVGGITMCDKYRTTSDITSNTDPITNLERVDDASFSIIGSGMTESSGTFSFPTTGVYQIYVQSRATASNDAAFLGIKLTTDNSNYTEESYATVSTDTSTRINAGIFTSVIFDVTNVSTHKVRFATSSMSDSTFYGDTNTNVTAFTFIRLGDT